MTTTRCDDVPETTVPPTLYKYCPPERIDILEGLQLRFSPPSSFNDTFYTYHLLPAASESRAKLDRVKLRFRLGVLCLAERSDNHLMWVNYARNHTGFVLGFDAKAAFFNETGRILKKVVYRSRPKVLPAPDMCACFYKSPEWEYEQEWRCVREFQQSEDRLQAIEPTLITEIILGHRLESHHISRIVQVTAAYEMHHVGFSLSSPSLKEWKFVNKSKTISLCASCGGHGYLMADPD